MSDDYRLELAAQNSADAVSALIAEQLSGAWIEPGRFETAGMIAVIRAASKVFELEVNDETWELSSQVHVSFFIYPSVSDEAYEKARQDMSLVSVALATEIGTDAILHYGFERPLLRAWQGVLTLYDWWPEWSQPEVADQLPPHEMGTYQGPLPVF